MVDATLPLAGLGDRIIARFGLIESRLTAAAADQVTIDAAIAHPHFGAMVGLIRGEYDAYVAAEKAAGGPVLTFLQWVLTNLPQILAAIQEIINFFSGGGS